MSVLGRPRLPRGRALWPPLRAGLRRAALAGLAPLHRALGAVAREAEAARIEALTQAFQSAGNGLTLGAGTTILTPAGLSVGHDVEIGAECHIDAEGGLQIRDNVRIGRGVTICCAEWEARPGGRRAQTQAQGQAQRQAPGQGRGPDAGYGAGAETDADPGPFRAWRQTVIERDVRIGPEACLRPGVRIGAGAMIGMGAVVAEDVPPGAFVGTPALLSSGPACPAASDASGGDRRLDQDTDPGVIDDLARTAGPGTGQGSGPGSSPGSDRSAAQGSVQRPGQRSALGSGLGSGHGSDRTFGDAPAPIARAASRRPASCGRPSRAAEHRAPRATDTADLPDMTFVLTTGRSGSTSIVDMFDAVPGVTGRHEPRLQLIAWSTALAHGEISRPEARALLEELYLDGSVYAGGHQLESDQKHYNLTGILAEVFPRARFIWLTRNGRDVVSSATGRSWYADAAHPHYARIPPYFHDYRVRGDLSGAVPAADWAAMTPFARNCWYWGHVNATIRAELAALPGARWIRVRVEDLAAEAHRIAAHVGVEATRLNAAHSNRAAYAIAAPATWGADEERIFQRWCGAEMEALYGRG